jgi:F0F1-type ATP synthase assembly protein I
MEPDKDNGQGNFWRQFGKYSHLAFVLPGAVVVGLLIGGALDRWLHTTWITLAGLLLGAVAGFYELIRTIIQASKET